MPNLSESIAIKAPIEKVFEVITDFEGYPGFLNEMESTKVLKRAKSKVRVAFTANIIKSVNYTLDMTLKSPGRVEWTFVEGEFMEDNRGSWNLTQLEPNLTDATFTVEVKFPFWVPASLGESTLKAGLPAMLSGFKTEAERRASKKRPAAKAAPKARKKVAKGRR